MIGQWKNESLRFGCPKCHYLGCSRKVDFEELSIFDRRFDSGKETIESETVSADISAD
jgi:hypothetical protein